MSSPIDRLGPIIKGLLLVVHLGPSLLGGSPTKTSLNSDSVYGLRHTVYGLRFFSMIERIKELLKADNWRPFTIHTGAGRSVHVPTRQHAWVSPHGRIVIETSATGLEVVKPEELRHVETEPWSDHEVC